ncbi:MAG: hypothetical protein ACSW8H_02680 [bacterium]
MRKKILAVFDREREFVERLVALAGRERGLPFSVHGFTEKEKLADFCKKERVEVLLLAEDLVSEENVRLPAGKVLCLSEERVKNAKGLLAVPRYQAARSLLAEAYKYADDPLANAPSGLLKGKVRTVGVYSPAGCAEKTALLLALGQQMSRAKASIFLSLEDFSGLRTLFRLESGSAASGLSDIFFLQRQGAGNLPAVINASVGTFGKLHILPPAAFAGELRDVSVGEWRALFDVLREKTAYEAILVDIGTGAGHLQSLLMECDRVYVPTEETPMGAARLEDFRRFLALEENRELREIVCPVRLPKLSEEEHQHFPEQLEWSGIGQTAREFLAKDPVFSL